MGWSRGSKGGLLLIASEPKWKLHSNSSDRCRKSFVEWHQHVFIESGQEKDWKEEGFNVPDLSTKYRPASAIRVACRAGEEIQEGGKQRSGHSLDQAIRRVGQHLLAFLLERYLSSNFDGFRVWGKRGTLKLIKIPPNFPFPGWSSSSHLLDSLGICAFGVGSRWEYFAALWQRGQQQNASNSLKDARGKENCRHRHTKELRGVDSKGFERGCGESWGN